MIVAVNPRIIMVHKTSKVGRFLDIELWIMGSFWSIISA